MVVLRCTVARLRHPVVVALFLAPILGEWLSTATPPTRHACGRRRWCSWCRSTAAAHCCAERSPDEHGLGLRGLCLLAAAYGVFEEALVDRFWFHPRPD